MIEYWPCGTISGEGHQELCVSQESHLFFKTNPRGRLETGTSIQGREKSKLIINQNAGIMKAELSLTHCWTPGPRAEWAMGEFPEVLLVYREWILIGSERWNDLHMGTQPVNKWSQLLGSKLVASPWVSCFVAHGNKRMSENHTLPLHLSPSIPSSLALAEAEVCLAWTEHGHPDSIPVGACSKQAFHGYGGGGGHGLARWAGLHPCHLLSSLLTTHSHWLLTWALQGSQFKNIYMIELLHKTRVVNAYEDGSIFKIACA